MIVLKAISVSLVSALMVAALPSARADIKLGQDRFFGHGTRGPYAISRQAVEAHTEQIWVSGRRMMKGQDYLFDAGLGALSFTEPVRFSDTVQVDYQYDTVKAHAPGATGGTLGLLSSGSGGLALTYAFRPDSAGNQTISNLGFTGSAAFAGSTLTSSFMVDKAAGANAGKEAQNLLLGMKRDTGKFQFNLGYSRVGQKFGQAEAMKLVKGSEALNFTGSLQLAQNGALTLKQVKNATPDAKTGVVKDTSLLSGGLGLNLSETTRLTALHEKQTEAQGKDSKNSTVDRVQLDQKLGGNTAATLLNETITSGKNGDSETVKATRFNVSTTGDRGLKVETALAMVNSSKSGSARDAGLKMSGGDGNLKIALALTDHRADNGSLRTHSLTVDSVQGRGLHLAAGISGSSGAKGAQERSSLSMEAGSNERLKLAMSMTNDTGKDKHGTATKFSMSSALSNGFKFSASRLDDQTTPDGGSSATKMNVDANAGGVKVAVAYAGIDDGKLNKETSGVNIEANPGNAVSIKANIGQKTDDKGSVRSNAVAVQTNPNGAVSLGVSHISSINDQGLTGANKLTVAMGTGTTKLTGSYADAQTPTGASSIKEAAVQMVPVKGHVKVSGAFSDEIKQNNTEVQIAMLQADIQPMAALAVSGSYKQRETGSPEQINTMNASVTLKPGKSLQMIGTYSSNPEEKDQVLRLVRKGLALQTQMGGLTFSGGYTQENGILDESQGTRAEFKLGLRCGKNSNLEGGYRQTIGAMRGYKPQLAYNVKYDHNIGSDFHLLLDANVVKNDDSVPVALRNDVKATANLGIRF